MKSLSVAVMVGAFSYVGKDTHTDVIYFHGTPTAQKKPGSPSALFQANIDYSGPRPTITNLELVVAEGDQLSPVGGVPDDQLPLIVGTLGTGSANSLGNYATSIAVTDFGATLSTSSAPGVYLYEPLFKQWTKRARFGDPSPDGGKFGGIFGDVVLNDDNSVTMAAATTAPAGPDQHGKYERFCLHLSKPVRDFRRSDPSEFDFVSECQLPVSKFLDPGKPAK